jgi:hypothetical protein
MLRRDDATATRKRGISVNCSILVYDRAAYGATDIEILLAVLLKEKKHVKFI